MATGLERLLDFSQPLDVQLLDEVCFVGHPRHLFPAVGGLCILWGKSQVAANAVQVASAAWRLMTIRDDRSSWQCTQAAMMRSASRSMPS